MERALTKETRRAKAAKGGGALFSEGLTFGRNEATTLGLGVLGFLIGRVMFDQTFNPAAIAFLSAFMCAGAQFYIILIFIGAGLLTKLGGAFLIKYAVCLGAMAVANFGLSQLDSRKFIKGPGVFAVAAAAAASVFCGSCVFMLRNGGGAYYIVLTALETALAFLASIVMRRGGAALRSGLMAAPGSNFGTEEIISLALILGLGIAGASDMTFGGVPLRIFLSYLCILAVAYKGGAVHAAGAGVLIGLVLYLAGMSDAPFPLIIAVSGMFAGLFGKKGKLAVILVFAACAAALTAYMTGGMPSREMFLALLTASAAFYFIPGNAGFYTGLFGGLGLSRRFAFAGGGGAETYAEHSERAKRVIRDKLAALAGSFEKLANSFNGISGAPERKRAMDKADIAALISDAARACCEPCERRVKCWETRIYETHGAIYEMLAACEKKGALTESDIPGDFRQACVAPDAFAGTLTRLYELKSVNIAWMNRLAESRRLAAQQLGGVAKIVRTLADEADYDITFNKDIESAVMKQMKASELPVAGVMAREFRDGGLELTISHTAGGRALCSPYQQVGKKRCREIIQAACKATGKRLKPAGQCAFSDVGGDDGCTLRLFEELPFKLQSGVSFLPKSGSALSGDSHAFFESADGRLYIVVSDGMGSGQTAHDESAAAVALFEEFVQAGFDRQLSVRIINSALVLKNTAETFQTLDVCCFDMRTGSAEFTKIGAAASYILRDGAVQTVRSTSLPMGILNILDSEVYSKQLRRGDMLLMVTDGANEAGGGLSDMSDKGWIARALKEFKSDSPQALADHILAEAQKRYGGEIRDDITVIASKVWER